MNKLYNLIVDTKLKTYQKVYGMKQYENNVVLNIQLVQNGTPLDLTGCTVRLNYQNKNEVLLQMANIIDETKGKVRVTVLTKVLDTIGDTPVDISVFDEHQKKITSATFVLVVQESIYSNDKIDEEELDLIQDIYSKEKERQEAEIQREENEKKREENDKIRDEKIAKMEKDCQECKEEVNTQIHKFDTQEQERKANEIERINNENARKTDEQQRVKQENAREENEKVRVTSETKRVESMDTIEKEWEEIKKDLGSQGGTGDMMKAVYDKNNDGIVDEAYNSARLDNTPANMYIKKEDNTTWQNINTNPSITTGDTPTIGLQRPSPTDKVLLEPFNANFTTIDEVMNRMGASTLSKLENVSITTIQKAGVYLVHNLTDAPDIPPKESRYFIVKCYEYDVPYKSYYHEVYSIGTGKMYGRIWSKGYIDIPCTSHLQPDEIYIDYTSGNDDNKGDVEHPVKTWECAYSRIPKILNKSIKIHLIDVSPSERIGLAGLTTISPAYRYTCLFIEGHGNQVFDVNIVNCKFDLTGWGISVKNIVINNKLRLVLSSTANISDSKIKFIEVDDSVAHCHNNTVANYDATNRAFIQIDSHTDHESLHSYGCFSTYGSLIYVSGAHPQGSVSETHEGFGGKVEYES